MTNDQKEKVITLRNSGLSMSVIAEQMGLSVNTVKSFCKRQKNKAQDDAQINADILLCKCCGTPVTQTPGRKAKYFCSDTCRMKWWNAHPEQVKHKHPITCTCAHCGKTFNTYSSKQRKYCSPSCYYADRFGGAA